MKRVRQPIAVSFIVAGVALAGCSPSTNSGNQTPAPGSTLASPSSSAANGAPPVQSPLPAKAVDGSPCDTALTAADVTEFIGSSDPAKHGENALGPKCDWDSAAGSGAGLTVFFHNKPDSGLDLSYRNVKPKAARWVELPQVQGFPAVAYLAAGEDPNDKSSCHIVVGISDDHAYAVDLTLGGSAQKKGIDACDAGRDVADRVMTNIKGRA